jgi:outer membrane protein
MATRIVGRVSGVVLIAATLWGAVVADGRGQLPSLPGPEGARAVPFRAGASFQASGFNTPPGPEAAAPAADWQPAQFSPASPCLTLPALTTSTPAGPAPVGTRGVAAEVAPAAGPPPQVYRLTLAEAKEKALKNSKLLGIGALNAQAKGYAVKAVQADYFPKVTGAAIYLHFQDDLGTVLTAGGRTVTGPKGTPLLTFPVTSVNVPVFNQDSSWALVGAVQPITDLLKVRQGVKIARADEQIAQAELEKGARALASGVEQLFWGLLAARRIQAGAQEGLRGAELLAKTQTLEARTALVEARQGLQQVDKQVLDLQEQLNALLDLPLCTTLELVEPPLPAVPVRCADEAVALALASSPEVREAQQTVVKAQAALCAGKLDYMPSIAAVGGYLNQTGQSYVQQDIGYVGVIGTVTFVDWGKRRNTIRQRNNFVTMAALKLHQTEDEVRQKTVKAFRELQESQDALQTARQMVELRKEAGKGATAAAALMAAAKALMLAEIDLVKADLAYRMAFVQLMSLIGKP